MSAKGKRGSTRVASVTVAFNPSPWRLAQQVAALRNQVDDIVIVDNCSAYPLADMAQSPGGLVVLSLPENGGVAKGFNVGIDEAYRRGAKFVLLLDHDSIPAAGMVDALLEPYKTREGFEAGEIAGSGPRVTDNRDHKEYPFIQLGWLSNSHLRCVSRRFVPCDFLISSGALIAMEMFDRVGRFDESLFIDSVDFEWCCRARSYGFILVGACAARMDHQLGDYRRRVTQKLSLVVHSPPRIYYMTRNRLLLYRRPYVPLKWKMRDCLRLFAKFVAIMAFIPPRAAYARMTWRAIRDAFAGRGGKL